MKKLKFKINLSKKQQEIYNLIHDKDVRYVVACMSRQIGKTLLSEILLIEYLCKPNTFNAYISPSFALGRKVFKELLKLLEGKNIIKSANSATLTIDSNFGSTLQFFSADAYTSIRGNTVSGILVLDECAFYPDVLSDGSDIFGNVIYPITKARKPKVLMISTPRGKRGFFWTYYNKALNNEDKCKLVQATIYDDSLVSEDEIKLIKSSISDLAFRQEFLVEFIDDATTFFKGFDKCFDNQTVTYKKTWLGVDFSYGSEDGDETVVTKINENNQVEQITVKGTLDEQYRKIADIINKSKNLQYSFFETNSLGLPMLNEIKKLVKERHKLQEWVTTNKTKEEIISNLAVAIANEEIHFDNSDTKLYSQLSNYVVTYSKTGKLVFNGRLGHDDAVMSLAMAYQAKETLNKTYTKDNFSVINVGQIKQIM